MTGGRAGGVSISESAALTARITTLSVTTALILTLAKLGGWWVGGSVALLASLADSALDVLAALGTFIAVRVAVSPPDAEHRFGHGKAEAFASLLQAGLIFATAALIGREAIEHLIAPKPIGAESIAIAKVTAIPYAAARLLELRKPATSSITANSSVQLMNGT